MKKKNEFESLFALNFIGQEVEFLTSLRHRSTQENEEGIFAEESPIAFRGFLLDVDEQYYYIGSSADEISKAIKKTFVIGIELVKYKNQYDEILDNFSTEGEGN